MRFTEETLMAYADGELDDTTRFQVELAMRQDPVLAEKIRQHQLLRANVCDAFSSTLHEQVPQRLHAVARSGKVVHLDSVRQLRTPPPPPAPEKSRWEMPEWGALAAMLVVGVLAGALGALGVQNLSGGAQLATANAGADALRAEGDLANALTQQLASATAPDALVRVGVSFVARDGNYCRSFMLPKMAGLACRNGPEWRIPVMAASAAGAAGDYRQAGAALPAAVLEAIDERIAGKALDANAERAAHRQGWKR